MIRKWIYSLIINVNKMLEVKNEYKKEIIWQIPKTFLKLF